MTKPVRPDHAPKDDLAPEDEVGQSSGEDAPPGSSSEKPAGITRLAATWMAHTRSSPFADVTEKITADHIDKSLDIADAQNERVARDRRDSRAFSFRTTALAFVSALVLVALLVFSDNAALLENLVEWLAAGGVGWAGGYGWASRRRS